ncbi:MAG: hypothetical protein NTX44_00365 [Ignavibacteriales bacterium]|nr:hypothetical protein [Ignavibacteriales bacterium]
MSKQPTRKQITNATLEALKPTPRQIEVAIQSLINRIEPAANQIKKLEEDLADSMKALESLIEAYQLLTAKMPPNLPKSYKETFLHLTPSTKIGDAMQLILFGMNEPLSKNEIIEKLRQYNIRLSMKHPRVVLNTALKNDKQNRFKVSEDGMVSLRKENEK